MSAQFGFAQSSGLCAFWAGAEPPVAHSNYATHRFGLIMRWSWRREESIRQTYSRATYVDWLGLGMGLPTGSQDRYWGMPTD